jgi:hypothetical protein
MAEQPAVLRRILEQGAPLIREVASAIAARFPRFVLPTEGVPEDLQPAWRSFRSNCSPMR